MMTPVERWMGSSMFGLEDGTPTIGQSTFMSKHYFMDQIREVEEQAREMALEEVARHFEKHGMLDIAVSVRSLLSKPAGNPT